MGITGFSRWLCVVSLVLTMMTTSFPSLHVIGDAASSPPLSIPHIGGGGQYHNPYLMRWLSSLVASIVVGMTVAVTTAVTTPTTYTNADDTTTDDSTTVADVSVPVSVFPVHTVTDGDTCALLRRLVDASGDTATQNKYTAAKISTMVHNTGISLRHISRPLDWILEAGPASRHRASVEAATDLGTRCLERLLKSTGLTTADVGGLVVSCSTAHTLPSVASRVMSAAGLDTERCQAVSVSDVGCGAGVVAIQAGLRVLCTLSDASAAVVVMCIETPSLMLSSKHTDTQALIQALIFADGACGLVLRRPGPCTGGWLGSTSVDPRHTLYTTVSHTHDDAHCYYDDDAGQSFYMTKRLGDSLLKTTPRVREFLDNTLPPTDGDRPAVLIHHVGGPRLIPKVNMVFGGDLGMSDPGVTSHPSNLASFRRVGNLVSASVFHALMTWCEDRQGDDGDRREDVVMASFGPGFCLSAIVINT